MRGRGSVPPPRRRSSPAACSARSPAPSTRARRSRDARDRRAVPSDPGAPERDRGCAAARSRLGSVAARSFAARARRRSSSSTAPPAPSCGATTVPDSSGTCALDRRRPAAVREHAAQRALVSVVSRQTGAQVLDGSTLPELLAGHRRAVRRRSSADEPYRRRRRPPTSCAIAAARRSRDVSPTRGQAPRTGRRRCAAGGAFTDWWSRTRPAVASALVRRCGRLRDDRRRPARVRGGPIDRTARGRAVDLRAALVALTQPAARPSRRASRHGCPEAIRPDGDRRRRRRRSRSPARSRDRDGADVTAEPALRCPCDAPTAPRRSCA